MRKKNGGWNGKYCEKKKGKTDGRYVISTGTKFREVVEITTVNNKTESVTFHEEMFSGGWGKRTSVRSMSQQYAKPKPQRSEQSARRNVSLREDKAGKIIAEEV